MSSDQSDIDAPKENEFRATQIAVHVLRMPFLRNILIVCLCVAILFPLYNWIYLKPSYRQMLASFSVEEAQRIAAHLVHMLEIGGQPLSPTTVGTRMPAAVQAFKSDFQIDNFKLFGPRGKVVYATDTQELGRINTEPHFINRVARGKPFARFVASGSRLQGGRLALRDIVEVYVPVMAEQAFLGAVAFYFDITNDKQSLDMLLYRSDLVLGLIALIMMATVAIILFKTGGAMLQHRKIDMTLHQARDQLERRVRERTMDLIDANKELQMEILERRQATTDLRESERRLGNLVETIPHGIREVDTEGIVTYANSAHAKIYGCRTSDLVGKSMFDLTSEDDEREKLKAHIDFILEQQPRPSPWFSKDGTRDDRTIDTQVDWNYKRDVQGRITGLIMVISDITYRKQAEKALLDNLQFMNTLIDTIPNPVFYKDAEGKFLGCNVAYAETLGMKKDNILGRRLTEVESIVSSDMAEHYHRQDIRLISNPGIQSYEERIRCADGVNRHYIFFKATFKDADDKVAGLVGIMLDISERKKVEKALAESKNLFDAFMHHLPGLAFMKDLTGKYIYVNESFSQFTDKPAWDQIGNSDDQVWEAETARVLQANDQKVLTGQTAQSNMETVRLHDLQERHLLTVRFPIFQDNQLFALGGISIDITQRTQAQQQRQQLELQLQQAQKMEALGTLAGGIAHDFNNILAAIIGYSEIAVAETEKDSSTQSYIQRVLEAGERARALVKQILAFSRQGEIEPKPVQVKLIVKEVLKLLRASLPATIDIKQQIDSDAAVMADPTQIHQVMMNLTTNAGYAMSDAGGCLTVVLTQTMLERDFTDRHTDLQPGPYLKLTVSDTGIGIAPEHLNRVFDPFFTTKPKGEGTGMGLAVVHGIISSLGGIISVESTKGQGTQFDVYLPIIEDSQAMAVAPVDSLPVGKERILFVDDEVFQTDMLKQMLGLLGYQVTVCNQSPAALDLFKQDPQAFDVVITDMIMPELTGDRLAVEILKLRSDIPIILATGYSAKITEAKAKALGIRAYALKPLVMEKLARMIRSVLDQSVVR
jgi:PAS domain S-box-containing protein